MAEFNRPGSWSSHQPRPDMGRSPQRSESSFGGGLGSMTEQAQDWAENASQMAGQVGQRAQEWAGQAAERAEDALDDVRGWVRGNPMATLLIVAGIGLFFALAFRATSSTSSSRRHYFG